MELKVGGELGGPGGLGEIDRASQLWGCRGPLAPLLARRHCRVGPLVKCLPGVERRLLVVGSFWPALGVWDEDWLSLGLVKAMTVVTDGMALEGGRSWQMYSAMLVQCLTESFTKISDLRLADLLDGGL